MRIRDEIKLTLAGYQCLHESSVSFGMRKAISAENEYLNVKEKLNELEEDKLSLAKQIEELKYKKECIEKRHLERTSNERRRFHEELNFAKKINHQLKCQIDGLLLAKQ